jgi:hypothetical protein
LTPAQIVNLRFPQNWSTVASAARPNAPAAARPVKAAARELENALPSDVFSPHPTYQLASLTSRPVELDRAELPAQTLAYADPAADSARNESARVPAPRPAAVAARPKPSNHVLNDAQLTSIKARLRLSESQERYWPAVEAALRNIVYKKIPAAEKSATTTNTLRTGAIDPNSAEVAQLKSAAIPLVLSLNEDQKREVRMLAHLMGLEKVASQF